MNTNLSQVSVPPIVDFRSRVKNRITKAPQVFDLTQAVPPFPVAPKIVSHLREALADPSLGQYTDPNGLSELREAIAEKHVLGQLGPDQVLITAGGNNALYLALTLLFSPGEKVALLEPYYFNHEMAVRILGLNSTVFALDPERGFPLDAAKLIPFLQASGAKGVVLVTPNNPTGCCYRSQEILTLVEWASAHGVEVVIDETYGDFDPDHLRDPRLRNFLGKGLSLVGSFSKTMALAGYRIGYFIGSEYQTQEALKIQDTALICAPHVSQEAALFGIRNCAVEFLAVRNALSRQQQLLQSKRGLFRHFCISGLGPYFAFVRHPFESLGATDATLKWFEETGILGLPGSFFGTAQESYVRIAYSNISERDLEEALDRWLKFDRSLS